MIGGYKALRNFLIDTTEAAVAAHVEHWFRQEGFDVEVQPVAPGRPNVLAMHGDRTKGPTLLLEGHTDVVTEGDPAQWTHPPFAGELVEGRIYGRGAADMKRACWPSGEMRAVRRTGSF